MQRGASLPSSQLVKLITRGKMSRLSAEPLLEFFRPLEAWLEVQNRDETVSYAQYFLKQLYHQ
jgi:peptidyl-dipeptidase A